MGKVTHYRHRANCNTLCHLSFQLSASIAAMQNCIVGDLRLYIHAFSERSKSAGATRPVTDHPALTAPLELGRTVRR